MTTLSLAMSMCPYIKNPGSWHLSLHSPNAYSLSLSLCLLIPKLTHYGLSLSTILLQTAYTLQWSPIDCIYCRTVITLLHAMKVWTIRISILSSLGSLENSFCAFSFKVVSLLRTKLNSKFLSTHNLRALCTARFSIYIIKDKIHTLTQ